MKISDPYLQNTRMSYVNQANGPNQPEKSPASREAKETPPSGDRVDLSAQSKEMQKIHDVLQATPEVRTDKVAQYKERIEEGEYQVGSEDIADKMLKESLLDLL